jgi:hypothetical protein
MNMNKKLFSLIYQIKIRIKVQTNNPNKSEPKVQTNNPNKSEPTSQQITACIRNQTSNTQQKHS